MFPETLIGQSSGPKDRLLSPGRPYNEACTFNRIVVMSAAYPGGTRSPDIGRSRARTRSNSTKVRHTRNVGTECIVARQKLSRSISS